MNELLHKELTDEIIKCYYTVYNKLGYGFLEKVYEKAMMIELLKKNLKVESQKYIEVYYDNNVVGEYYADLIVEDKVIIELKACEHLREEHELQLINYLRATTIEIGLLMNFGKEPEFSRKIFSNKTRNKSNKNPH
jgi:GxxExxY protein